MWKKCDMTKVSEFCLEARHTWNYTEFGKNTRILPNFQLGTYSESNCTQNWPRRNSTWALFVIGAITLWDLWDESSVQLRRTWRSSSIWSPQIFCHFKWAQRVTSENLKLFVNWLGPQGELVYLKGDRTIAESVKGGTRNGKESTFIPRGCGPLQLFSCGCADALRLDNHYQSFWQMIDRSLGSMCPGLAKSNSQLARVSACRCLWKFVTK